MRFESVCLSSNYTKKCVTPQFALKPGYNSEVPKSTSLSQTLEKTPNISKNQAQAPATV